MAINYGSKSVKEIWYGSKKVKEVWYGSKKVWASAIEITIIETAFVNRIEKTYIKAGQYIVSGVGFSPAPLKSIDIQKYWTSALDDTDNSRVATISKNDSLVTLSDGYYAFVGSSWAGNKIALTPA